MYIIESGDDDPVITTGRLILRRPRIEDAAGALAMLRDSETLRWNPIPGVIDLDIADLDIAAGWCARGADWSAGDHATFSVLDVTTGGYLGNVSVHDIDQDQCDAEVGYRIAPWARGRRFAAEALAAASAWAFHHLPLVRIELVHAAPNVPSCGVAVRAGYPLEGVLRQSFVYGDGVRYDEHLHARLNSDPPPPADQAGTDEAGTG